MGAQRGTGSLRRRAASCCVLIVARRLESIRCAEGAAGGEADGIVEPREGERGAAIATVGRFLEQGQRVVMLGAGGAGRAMAVEIAWAGAAHLTLVTRRREQGEEVADRVRKASGVPCEWQAWSAPVRLPKGTTMLMNATHLGCAPHLEAVPVDWSTMEPGCLAVDVITNPRITPFLQAARDRGCPIVDGVEMLVQLAMQIFERWTGIRPEEAVFQRAVAAALGERAV